MRASRLSRVTMPAVAALLFYGILTLWVPARWALSSWQVGIFALAFVWAVNLAARPFPLGWHPAMALAILPPAWGLIQLATGHTVYRWATANSILDWAADAALFFLTFQFAGHDTLRRRFLNAVLYFGCALSVVSTIQMFTSGGKIFWIFPSGYTSFVLGPFVYENQYSAFIELILPLALFRAISQPRQALRYWLMVSAMAASVAAAASRAGGILVLAEVLAGILLAWRRGPDRRSLAWGVAQFAALAVAFTAVVGWDNMWSRFQRADQLGVRREILLSSLQMIREKPAMGFGLGAWPTVYPAHALYDIGKFMNQAHNDWAQWAVEGGLPLAAVMLLFAVMLFRPAVRSLWGLGLIAVLIHCCVDYPMQQRPALGGFVFAFAGVLLASRSAAPGAVLRPYSIARYTHV